MFLEETDVDDRLDLRRDRDTSSSRRRDSVSLEAVVKSSSSGSTPPSSSEDPPSRYATIALPPRDYNSFFLNLIVTRPDWSSTVKLSRSSRSKSSHGNSTGRSEIVEVGRDVTGPKKKKIDLTNSLSDRDKARDSVVRVIGYVTVAVGAMSIRLLVSSAVHTSSASWGLERGCPYRHFEPIDRRCSPSLEKKNAPARRFWTFSLQRSPRTLSISLLHCETGASDFRPVSSSRPRFGCPYEGVLKLSLSSTWRLGRANGATVFFCSTE